MADATNQQHDDDGGGGRPTDEAGPGVRSGLPGIEPLAPPAAFLEDARALGVAFDPGDLEQLGRFLTLLLKANETTNLTAIRDPAEAWRKHVLDALTLLPLLAELPDGGRVGDVGSGGGVPALPLAIVLPRLRFECVESTGKKAAFIAAAATALGLPNVDVLNERAEDAGAFERRSRAESRRDAYDAVTARAVGRIAVLAELTVPLAKVGGRVLMIKGAKADEELAEAKQALHMLHAAHAGTIETPTGRIVVIEKLRQSPRVYPRKPGTPKSQPLGVSGS